MIKLPAHLTRIILVIVILIVSFSKSSAQTLSYGFNHDKRWSDSVIALIKKYERYDEEKFIAKLKLKYFLNCIEVGQYFEKLYRKKQIASIEKALFYYKKVSDHGQFPWEVVYYPAAALRNNMCRKLAAMYFSGDGVKKDLKLSLGLALKGSSGMSGLFKYYSNKYFKCNCIILKSRSSNNLDDFEYQLNPFYLQSGNIRPESNFEQLEYVAASFKHKSAIGNAQKITITIFPRTSMRSQSRTSRLMEGVEKYLIEQLAISADRIEKKTIFGSGDQYSMVITIL